MYNCCVIMTMYIREAVILSMKKRKRLKKLKEPVNYEGRRYKDYLKFIENNPTIPTTQMDTVYNHQDGPYIQTFIF